MDREVLSALIGVVGVILGGGGVWAYLNGWANRKITREESEITRLRGDVQKLRDELSDCETRHDTLEKRIEGLEQAQDSHLARWIKDSDRRLTWCNAKAFLTIFAPLGYTRDFVQGKSFADLGRFDQEAVAEIDRLDEAALAHDGAATTTMVKLHPLLPLMHIVKVAAAGKMGELIFEGYAYRSNDPDVDVALGAMRQREAIIQSTERMAGGDSAGKS